MVKRHAAYTQIPRLSDGVSSCTTNDYGTLMYDLLESTRNQVRFSVAHSPSLDPALMRCFSPNYGMQLLTCSLKSDANSIILETPSAKAGLALIEDCSRLSFIGPTEYAFSLKHKKLFLVCFKPKESIPHTYSKDYQFL